MKKVRIMVLAILLIIVIGVSAAYFIYGSTLINITSEKSINNHIAIDPQKPITILKTAQVGDYFGILYKDPLNEDYDYTFRYITKSPFYKNRYYNTGGYLNVLGSGMLDFIPIKSSNEKENKTDVLIGYFGNSKYEYNQCSVFTYDMLDIDFEKITKDEEIAEKCEAMADSLKKIDEFEIPDDNMFIITKTYNLDYPYDIIICDGSISEVEKKQQIIADADALIKEYHDYLKGKNNE